MDAPSEIVLSILSYLARPNLKSTRLVSKRWSLCAAEYLFDVIYVSPSKEDVDVFQAITHHPVLSDCPQRLEYVGNEFLSHYPKDKYAKDLWNRTHWQVIAYSRASGEQWLDPDPKINTWINETGLSNLYSNYEDIDSFYDNTVISDAYLKYQEHANYQQNVLDGLQSSQFVEILVEGLQHLSSLASVTLQPNWPWKNEDDCRDIRSGSPLARSWHIFYPEPRGWGFDQRLQDPDGARHYLIISSALARAQKRIRKFKVGRDLWMRGALTQNVFDSHVHSNTGLEIAAFSGLEHCDITLAFHHDRNRYNALEKTVHNLQLLLASMDRLGFLSLRLPYLNRDQGLYPSGTVLSAVKVWSKLTTLKLEHVSTTAMDLLQLLIFQMPTMQHLELGGIKLLKGTWHSVIEGLKQSNRISTFQIPYCRVLEHLEGTMFMRGSSRFLSPVRNYIIHGGHHPCIPPNEPSHAAQGYMADIEVSVRGRLVEMDSTRSEALDSVARKACMDAMPEWSDISEEFNRFDGSQACWETLIKMEMNSFGYEESNFTL